VELEILIEKALKKAEDEAKRKVWRARKEAEREVEIVREQLEEELKKYEQTLRVRTREEIEKETSRTRAELRKKLYSEASSLTREVLKEFRKSIASFKKDEAYRSLIASSLKRAVDELGEVSKVVCAKDDVNLVKEVLEAHDYRFEIEPAENIIGGVKVLSKSGLYYEATLEDLFQTLESVMTAEAFEMVDDFVERNFS